MELGSHLTFVVFLGMIICPYGHCKTERSLMRVLSEEGGLTVRIYSDGANTVTAYFDDKNEVVDCAVMRANTTLSNILFSESLSDHTSRSDKSLRHQTLLGINVLRLARRCNKFHRDTRRKLENDPSSVSQQVLARRLLNSNIEGTIWCGRKPDPKANVIDKKTNACCSALHNCPDIIPGNSKSQGLYNYDNLTLPSCKCVHAFRSCLKKTDSKLSKTIGNLYFNSLKFSCFHLQQERECTSWDHWFIKCKKHDKRKVAVRKQVSTF